MNEFLKSLQAFGMEGMGTEVEIEAYANSECAEELIELDNLDAATVAMESMADAVMEGGLEMQTLALESAGFTLDTASGFTGELSNEAVGNMVKRGYYEVKIQIKKVLQKVWKLILAVVDHVIGAEGRLKSYGKLFKKYNERLRKIHPKEGKDGEDKEVTVRNWQAVNVPAQVEILKIVGGESGWIKKITTGVKSANVKETVCDITDGVQKLIVMFHRGLSKMGEKGTAASSREMRNEVKALTNMQPDEIERFEKEFEESMGDEESAIKDNLKDFLDLIKDVDSDSVNIYTAKENLLSIGNALEEMCKRDLKFKKELMNLRKAWDKKTGEWDLKNIEDENTKRVNAAILRIFNKCGKYITAYRLAVSQFYKAVTSNMQGVLADMAKVIAKGTNIGA